MLARAVEDELEEEAERVSPFGQSGCEQEAYEKSAMGEYLGDDEGDNERSDEEDDEDDEVEDDVDGGEGVALSGKSMAAEKAREGKEPVRRREGVGIVGDMVEVVGGGGSDDCSDGS